MLGGICGSPRSAHSVRQWRKRRERPFRRCNYREYVISNRIRRSRFVVAGMAWSRSAPSANHTDMLNVHSGLYQPRLGKALAVAILGLGLIWILPGRIVSGDLKDLIFPLAVGAGAIFLIAIVDDWRNGIYFFFIWLVFEDLIRKFAGNNMFIFFAKDAMIGLTYLSMLIALRRRQLATFKPPFLPWLSIFVFCGLIQVFNPNTPSVLYGILGFKLYFYYIPLMFAGYALLRSEADLHKVLMLNMWIALVVAGLGIAQSVLGLSFLSPTELSPDLLALGRDIHYSPITHLEVQRGTSVYVSDGRFAEALVLFYTLGIGTAVYLLLRTKRGRKLVFPTVGVVVLATVMLGVRHSFIAVLAGTVALVAGMMWGGPPGNQQMFRIAKAIRLAAVFAAIAIVLMIFLFPDAIAARWALYAETLSPGSSASELGYRAWDYPMAATRQVFTQPNWQLGNGLGTASLGVQYVSGLLGVPRPEVGSESGAGSLVVEFGIVGPVLWVLWTGSLLYCSWKVVRNLRRTPLFPVGFAIFWYALYILVFESFYGLPAYQNYLANAYLWLTIGMLFRMPGLLVEQAAQAPQRNAISG